MKLVLLRGPSSTGKSTIASYLSSVPGHRVSFHETDKFFVDENGVYRFDANLLAKAHAWNQQEVRMQMLCKTQLVVVSNTFIKRWEMKYYLDLANAFGYEVEIIRTPEPWDAEMLFNRNKHGVPLDTIKRQINKFQPHKDELVWKNMSIFQ